MRLRIASRASDLILAIAVLAAGHAIARGQGLGSLKSVNVPEPPELNKYVRDRSILTALGKALFWDMQAGSDGRVACATCHFHAGADHRAQNQLASSSAGFRVNQTLRAGDFPFHAVANVDDNRSEVLRDTAAIAGSAGLFRRIFTDIVAGSGADDGFDTGDAAAFSLNGINTRRVTTRNTPTVINAVFNHRNFWDGRAKNIFTGFTPFGESDIRMNSLILLDGRLAAERVHLENASLASQAVGPPLNSVEMSYDGRTWPKFGKKMLELRPLASQRVAPDDSVLGPFAAREGSGLMPGLTYLLMVQAAFRPEYWSSAQLVDATGRELGRNAPATSTSEFTQAEFNFALFWGLALQAYQATLISNDSRFDRFSEGDSGALTDEEQQGLRVFRTSGGCQNCHSGPEFTAASFDSVNRRPLQRGRDTGFFRTGVRPIAEDSGIGADDDFGQPLSIAVAQSASARTALQGVFKTPGLRDVEFTGPFFHNGGQATLEQVIDFYARGGDFPEGGNLGPGIRRRNLSQADKQALIAFMKALSDDRVRFERAPFDHPELCIPSGHPEAADRILEVEGSDRRFLLSAADRWVGIPAVGRSGNSVPLQTFDELLTGTGSDGSRAHALIDACAIP